MAERNITSVRSSGILEEKPVSELLKLYQSLVPGDLPEFRDKGALVRACIIELAKQERPGRRRRVAAKPVEKEPKNRKPWAFDPTMLEPKQPRKGSKREKLIGMMRKGATFAEIQEALGWTYKQAFVQMRAVNTQNGWGVYERNKRLYLFSYEEGPPSE